jgi:hypothetical protein
MGKNLFSTEEKNDKNVNNKCKYVKENYEFRYYPKVSPTKKTVLNNVNQFVLFLDYVSNLFFQKCELFISDNSVEKAKHNIFRMVCFYLNYCLK